MHGSAIQRISQFAESRRAINLAQGRPDFDSPPEAAAALRPFCNGDCDQYTLTWGHPVLREAIARKYLRFYGDTVDPETEVTVCCGATEAMISTLIALVEPGDEIILFEPFYENHYWQIAMSGACPRIVRLRPPQWKFDEAELAAAFHARTRAVVLCNPQNPTGKLFDLEELSAIFKLCQRHGATLIADEVYEHIVFGDAKPTSACCLPDFKEHGVIVNSFSKTFNVTGWRVGYAVSSPQLTSRIRRAHDYITACAPSSLQNACAMLLNVDDDYYSTLVAEYSVKRDILTSALSEAGVEFVSPDGAYYVFAKVPARHSTDVEFVEHLITEVGVSAVPGSAFYEGESNREFVRFCFCRRNALLEVAKDKMKRMR